jgi:hypothetical protein
MITKKQLLKSLKDGKTIYNYVWWFIMFDNGTIIGGCPEEDCCQWEFNNFEDMYKNFDKKDWKL